MKYLIAVVSFLFVSSYANAGIVLKGLFYNLNDAITLESVSNSSETNSEFVKIEVYEMVFDAISQSYLEVELKDPTQLVIAPSRLVIPPSGTVPFRVIRKPADELKLYRVYFNSIIPTAKEGFKDEDVDQYKDEVKAGLTLSINLGAVMYSNPVNPHYDTKIEKTNDGVNIVNKGNAVIKIDYIKSCDKNKKCENMPVEHLRPNKSLDLKGENINFIVDENNKSTSYSF